MTEPISRVAAIDSATAFLSGAHGVSVDGAELTSYGWVVFYSCGDGGSADPTPGLGGMVLVTDDGSTRDVSLPSAEGFALLEELPEEDE